MIKLIRCDDRLIHGQCVTQIIPTHDIKEIIAIDDATAGNSVLKKVFMMAAPKGVKTTPVTFEEAIPMVKEAVANDVNTLLLMRVPEQMEKLLEAVPELPKDLNVASVPPADGKVEIAPAIFFSQEQLESAKRMSDNGVHIWFQLIPQKPVIEWDNIKSKYF
jgi:mannose/fructose/N-acetylgalactosamine-specific phosphotransferase system component IIB